jgi:hypothetical protein
VYGDGVELIEAPNKRGDVMTTKTKETQVVAVWYDESAPNYDGAWVVADEDHDEQSCAAWTQTIKIFGDDYDDAVEFAFARGREKGVRVVETDEHGMATELASADTMLMQAMLMRHGPRFTGNNVNDEAEYWADQGFRVDDADEWCEIGVWDAATAVEFRDAGLTPDQAKSAAESLTDGLDDPAEEYTDGDPIYSACNGDTKTSVIIDAARRQ